jgi:Domain of unknown function (DUF4252)
MKKLILSIALLLVLTIVSGQRSIDALFNRYAGSDGFVTITLNGDLLKLLGSFDNDDCDRSFPAKVSQIRILVQQDENHDVENFYNKVIKDINLKNYEEFMRIKESDQDLRMLVRAKGNIFNEFLLVGGGEDNLLIQIKGEMTFKEAKRFSKDVKKDHGLSMIVDHK